MIASLTQTMGNVSASADACNINRDTHYVWMKKDEKYASEVIAMRERALDFAEGALMKRIQDGSDSSIQFFLKMKAKDRGYIETQHHITDAPQDNLKNKSIEELLEMLPKEIQERLSKKK